MSIPKGKRCDHPGIVPCLRKATCHREGSSFYFCAKHYPHYLARFKRNVDMFTGKEERRGSTKA